MTFARIATIAALAVVLLITIGCKTVEPTVVTKVVERKVDVPKSLLECMPEPQAREVWETQEDVALYVERLALAGADCRTRLAKVKKLVGSQ